MAEKGLRSQPIALRLATTIACAAALFAGGPSVSYSGAQTPESAPGPETSGSNASSPRARIEQVDDLRTLDGAFAKKLVAAVKVYYADGTEKILLSRGFPFKESEDLSQARGSKAKRPPCRIIIWTDTGIICIPW